METLLTSSTLDASAVQPSKTLLLVGGAWEFPATQDPYGVSIYLDFLKRAGGVENAKIGIFTTASSSGVRAQRNGELYIQDFRDLYDLYLKDEYPNAQIQVEWIPFHIDNYNAVEKDPVLIERIKSYTGFIFGGGDQSFITEAFFNEDPETGTRTETEVYKALKERYEAGAVVAGTSAGTAVQTSSPMITAGESYEALLDGSVSLIGSPPFEPTLHYNPLGGLGFFDYGMLDTHFSERGRQGRIIRLAADLETDLTFGVDENTALIVTHADTPEVNLEVLGEGGVFISDLSNATVDESAGYWSISGVKATYITEGDQYDPLSKSATFGEKTVLTGEGDLLNVPATENIFSRLDPETGNWTDPRTFTETAIDVFESQSTSVVGVSDEADPVRYGVAMTEVEDSQGFSGLDSVGVENVSFANLDLTIAPVYIGSQIGDDNEVLDLRAFADQQVLVSFETSSEAAFDNVVGFYLIQDEQGTVVDPLTGETVQPDSPDYAAAAIRQSQTAGLSFKIKETAPVVTLQGGSLYAPFLIANGTVEQVLNEDVADDPVIFFNFSHANPFELDHIKSLGLNQIGFEDLMGGGDLDYNDAMLQFSVQVV
jgi:cyanophycinase